MKPTPLLIEHVRTLLDAPDYLTDAQIENAIKSSLTVRVAVEKLQALLGKPRS